MSADEQGAIKTWDVGESEFRLLNGIKLSALCGAVSSVALPVIASGKGSDEEEVENGSGLEIFVGTTENFLLRGALLQSTSYDIVFEVSPKSSRHLSHYFVVTFLGTHNGNSDDSF